MPTKEWQKVDNIFTFCKLWIILTHIYLDKSFTSGNKYVRIMAKGGKYFIEGNIYVSK
jgi:hypothetical protein